jgi:hypothetical protein
MRRRGFIPTRVGSAGGGLMQAAANMVILKRLQVSIELPETFLQGLKPSFFAAIGGTTEVVPFQRGT